MTHEQRDRAESFGERAEEYDRYRPTYPDALVDDVLDGLTEPRVLDVGCGTGIATRALVERGARVIGVEVDARMAEVARRDGLEVEVGAFETWDAAGRVFDRVTAAQAWHWVDPTVGPSKAAAVLVEGGRLSCFWNVGRMREDLARRVDPIYEEFAPTLHASSVQLGSRFGDVSAEWDQRWLEAFSAYPGFGAPRSRRYEWQEIYSSTVWVAMLRTHSDHALLEADQREELLRRVGDVIDELGGSLSLDYTTYLIEATRL